MKRILCFTLLLLFIAPTARYALAQNPSDDKKDAVSDDAVDADVRADDAKEGDGDADADGKKDGAKDKDDVELEETKPVFKLRGYAKDMLTFHRTNSFLGDDALTPSSKNLFSNLTRVRLSPEFKYRDYVYMIVDFDNELIASNYNRSRDFNMYWRPSGYNDFFRMTWEPVYNRRILYRTKIHRAYAKFSAKYFTATIGRQQIRFGSGRLWNPLDILNPISPTTLEGAEEQKGTDALRLDFYPTETSEISIVYSPKRYDNRIDRHYFEKDNYVARVKTAISDFEFAVLGGYISERGVAGLDITAVVLKGILRGAAICAKPTDGKLYFQANAGYEYTFKNGIFFLVEYFYNQNGINYNSKLKAAYLEQSYLGFHQYNRKYIKYDNYNMLANQFLTVNQHYVALALGYDFMPLLRGELFLMGDIQGRGIFASPTLTYNAIENMDIQAGVMMAFVFNGMTSDFREFDKNYFYNLSVKYSF